MRGRAVLVTLVLVALTTAAPSAAAEPLVSDPSGDVAVEPAGAALPDNAQTAAADLVSLEVVEGETDFTFTVGVAGLGQQGGTLTRYALAFTWGDALYQATFTRSQIDPTAEPLVRGALLRGGGEGFDEVAPLDVVADDSAGTFTFVVGKVYIVSLEGHSPVPGSQLTEVFVSSRGDFTFGPGQGARIADRMPDSGGAAITYTKGGEANGHLVLESQDPVRVSNGGATTFVYQAHLQNALDTDDEVILSVSDLPEGWSARVDSPILVPAADEKSVYALASIPFGHEHGGFSAFTLTAQSQRHPDVKATIRLGVLHTPIPQPAGHHAELYLHATPSDTGIFGTTFPGTTNTMNTLSDHADDVALAAANVRGGASWTIPLGPRLTMGMDFDVNQTGELVGAVVGRAQGEGTLAAELWLVRGGDDALLLGEAPPLALTLDLQTSTPFALTVTPTSESDYVPYAPGQNLELRLELDSTAPFNPQQPPALDVETFLLKLPLNEYNDIPTDPDGIVATVTLVAEGLVQKVARPGAVITYAWTVTNTGDETAAFEPSLAGVDAALATYAPEGALVLEAGASARLILAVDVPGGAAEGQVLEAILVVRSAADPSNLAIGRTLTTVGTGITGSADESEILREAQRRDDETPGAGLAALALAGALAALAARRGRR